jgi:hypothetical protein
MTHKQSWRSYEEVARYLLDRFKDHFGLELVEPKQSILGVKSGTSWEIDAKGVLEGEANSAVMIVECRQRRSKGLNQEALGALAYRIIDTGAKGGIIVSPLPLQHGAKKVAEATNIVHVLLDPDSTSEDFAMSFFDKIFVSKGERIPISEHVQVRLVDKNGTANDC